MYILNNALYAKTDYINAREYGYLYNWHVIPNTYSIVNRIDNTGYRVPTREDALTLETYIGGLHSGGKLKETGTTHWLTPNAGATNETNFTALPGGYRILTGAFIEKGEVGNWWLSEEFDASKAYEFVLTYEFDAFFQGGYIQKFVGKSIRLMKDYAGLEPDGTVVATYIGNDQKEYDVIKIGTQAWVAKNLEETKYENKILIPYVKSNASWGSLTSGARCSYGNI